MTHVLRALTALALVLPTVAVAAVPAHTAKTKQASSKTGAKAGAKRAAKVAPKPVATPDPAMAAAGTSDAESAIIPSVGATRVAEWVAASGDNHALPYAIIDKTGASLFLFNAKGEQVAAVPVLVGIAPGDDASPGIGAKKLAEIGPAEKTTPAGRFLAKFGLALGRERILWVDYTTSVALHPIPADASSREHRRERMLSPTPEDNRVTFGCINVPKAFYGRQLRPLFLKKGGYVYVLPDTKPIEEVFPRLRVQAVAAGAN